MALQTQRQYLDHAKAAYTYVKQTMRVGAGNKLLGQPGGPQGIFARRSALDKVRAATGKREQELDQATAERIKTYYQKLLKLGSPDALGTARLYQHVEIMKMHGELIEFNALKAAEYGAGNCEEQSSLTFKFLRDRNVKPLDWMKKEGFFGLGLGNHAFVIIGRDKKTDPSDISTWNPEVVYCDPYEDELGGLDRIQKCFQGEKVSLLYRWDDFPKPISGPR